MREKYRKRRKLFVRKISLYDMQSLCVLLGVELVFWLYAVAKGRGLLFFQISLAVIPLSLLCCYMIFRMNADRYLLIFTVFLLNFGFLLQMFAQKEDKGLLSATVLKCCIAFAAAIFFGGLFWKFSFLLSMDRVLPLMAGIQALLCLLLFLFGKTTGDREDQGAVLNLDLGPVSVQPLELVKILYIFVMVILLCKEEKKDQRIFWLPRELLAILYTAVLGLAMLLLFSELGTFLIMFLVGGILFLIYSRNRKNIKWLLLLVLLCAALGAGACILFREVIPPLGKVYNRFYYMAQPELDALGDGYQGLLAKKALTVGGALGPDTDRYLFTIPQENNDLIFAKLVQTCGFVTGVFMILSFLLLLRQGMKIAGEKEDIYYSGLATGITLLFAMEGIVHIACNIGLFPITGIPLYFVSQGFTSLTTGMVMMGFLLVMSADNQERREDYEKIWEERFQRLQRSIFPSRRRA